MLWTVFFVAFLPSGTTTALNENDWIDAIVEVYSTVTKYLNHGNVGDSYRDLYTSDAEVLWPAAPLARNEDVLLAQDQLSERYRIDQHYLAFVELLYSSSDVAVVRDVSYPDFVDGGQRKANGLTMFVRNESGTRVRLAIINFS